MNDTNTVAAKTIVLLLFKKCKLKSSEVRYMYAI